MPRFRLFDGEFDFDKIPKIIILFIALSLIRLAPVSAQSEDSDDTDNRMTYTHEEDGNSELPEFVIGTENSLRGIPVALELAGTEAAYDFFSRYTVPVGLHHLSESGIEYPVSQGSGELVTLDGSRYLVTVLHVIQAMEQESENGDVEWTDEFTLNVGVNNVFPEPNINISTESAQCSATLFTFRGGKSDGRDDAICYINLEPFFSSLPTAITLDNELPRIPIDRLQIGDQVMYYSQMSDTIRTYPILAVRENTVVINAPRGSMQGDSGSPVYLVRRDESGKLNVFGQVGNISAAAWVNNNFGNYLDERIILLGMSSDQQEQLLAENPSTHASVSVTIVNE